MQKLFVKSTLDFRVHSEIFHNSFTNSRNLTSPKRAISSIPAASPRLESRISKLSSKCSSEAHSLLSYQVLKWSAALSNTFIVQWGIKPVLCSTFVHSNQFVHLQMICMSFLQRLFTISNLKFQLRSATHLLYNEVSNQFFVLHSYIQTSSYICRWFACRSCKACSPFRTSNSNLTI